MERLVCGVVLVMGVFGLYLACGVLLDGVTQGRVQFRLMGMVTSRGLTETEDVYRRFADELTCYATGLVGPFDTADVVSEACLRAFTSSKWHEVSNHRAYLYRTVFSVANDLHRSTLARRLRELKAAAPVAVFDPDVDVDVLDAVGRLSMRQRSAVILTTYWADLTPDEVAARMNVSSGSLKRHLAMARRVLRSWSFQLRQPLRG